MTSMMGLLNKTNPIILEIGAADGEDSLKFLDDFPDISLYCFEPDPRAIGLFKKAVLPNDNCNLYKIAISDKDGRSVFYASSGKNSKGREHIYSGSLKKPKLHTLRWPNILFSVISDIKTVRLDTWYACSGLNYIDFIWADVQGSEELLIRGGRNTLSKTHYFYTEYNNIQLYEDQLTLDQIKKLLGDDFAIKEIWANDVLFVNKKWKGVA